MTPAPAPTIESLQRDLAMSQQQARAVSQYLWLAIRALRGEEHEVTLKTDNVDPLWGLVFMQVNDKDGNPDPSQIQILAATHPAMTEQEKKRLVRRLTGTDVKFADAMTELKLDFPQAYTEQFISDRVKWNLEKKIWEKVGVDNTPHTPHTS